MVYEIVIEHDDFFIFNGAGQYIPNDIRKCEICNNKLDPVYLYILEKLKDNDLLENEMLICCHCWCFLNGKAIKLVMRDKMIYFNVRKDTICNSINLRKLVKNKKLFELVMQKTNWYGKKCLKM